MDDRVYTAMIKTVLPQAIADRPAAEAGLRCWVDMGSAEGEMSEFLQHYQPHRFGVCQKHPLWWGLLWSCSAGLLTLT